MYEYIIIYIYISPVENSVMETSKRIILQCMEEISKITVLLKPLKNDSS